MRRKQGLRNPDLSNCCCGDRVQGRAQRSHLMYCRKWISTHHVHAISPDMTRQFKIGLVNAD